MAAYFLGKSASVCIFECILSLMLHRVHFSREIFLFSFAKKNQHFSFIIRGVGRSISELA